MYSSVLYVSNYKKKIHKRKLVALSNCYNKVESQMKKKQRNNYDNIVVYI